MLSKPEISVIATSLFDQHESRAPFLAFSDRIPTMADANDVQDAFVDLLLGKEGAKVGGYKIALTSRQMREWLKIYEPCAGQVLSTRIYGSPHTIRVADYVRISVETELCVVLDRELSGPCTTEDVRQSLRCLYSAYELVEDRGADLAKLDAKSLVSDNSWNAGIVVGAPGPPEIDLINCRGLLKVNGRPFREGNTAEVMDGDPLEAVAWLAGHLGQRGRSIKAGQPVMTGSIMKTQFLGAGNVLEFAIDGLPPVELRLT